MNSKIDIGIKIDLETFLETKLLIEADSGSGKSWTIRKLAEECCGKVQQIIIDPEGDFITLREKYPFALVSKGGDIPLNIRYAEALAHKILETGISVIIDLYEFKQPEREQFVRLFCEALMNAPKSLRHSCLVYIDEAQLFCPEDKRAISTSAVVDLCTRGRKRGLCAILATLRISILNKSSAAQCKNKMMGSTSLPLDQKRVGDELGLRTKEEIRDLRNLGKGEFYAFGPAISKEIVKFKVGAVKTTHIKSGSKLVSTPPTPSAIKKILSKLEDIPEEAEKELTTKQEFQKEIIRLRREVKTLKSVAPSVAVNDGIKVIKLKEKINELSTGIKERDAAISAHQKAIVTLNKKWADAATQIGKVLGKPINIELPEVKAILVTQWEKDKPVVNRTLTVKKDVQPHINGEKSVLVKCSREIIKFLSQYPDRDFSLAQVGVVTGYSPRSGGFNNSISELFQKGFIIRDRGKIQANENAASEIAATIGEVASQEYNIETFKSKLPKCERLVYEHLLSSPESWFTLEELGAATNYSPTSGGFSNALSKLNTLELIERQRGQIRLNQELVELI